MALLNLPTLIRVPMYSILAFLDFYTGRRIWRCGKEILVSTNISIQKFFCDYLMVKLQFGKLILFVLSLTS